MPEAPARIRLDKWLWHARFAKSRSIAAGLVSGGHLRVNGQKAQKTAQPVGPGDVLTIALGACGWCGFWPLACAAAPHPRRKRFTKT